MTTYTTETKPTNIAAGHNAYTLAGLAGCGEPDSLESAGAEFLNGIAQHFAESEETDEIDCDRWHEIADSAVPIYTYARWQTFTDLSAYFEDVTELGHDGSDLTEAAGIALYMIAERLCSALANEIA